MMKKGLVGIRSAAAVLLSLLLALQTGCGRPASSSEASTPLSSAAESSATVDPGPSQAAAPETDPRVQALLDRMTIEEKIYQLFIVSPEQLTGTPTVTVCTEEIQAALAASPAVGGVILFAANIVSPTQCTDLIAALQKGSAIPLFVAVDEEGGSVARVGNNAAMGTTRFPNMNRIQTAEEAYRVGSTIGSELRQFGFNLDFAPVADVNSNPKNPVIGVRSFSADPQQAALLVAAAVRGFRDSGMLCTLKHFPGHGDTVTDSHYGYAEVDKTLTELEAVELIPFRAGCEAGADFVMLGHLSVPKVTGDQTPATLSAPLVSILRDKLGYQGLIVTDAMQMQAITKRYSAAQAAVLAIEAGVDVILLPEHLQEAAQGIVEAVHNGRIEKSRIEKSVRKILQKKLECGILQ